MINIFYIEDFYAFSSDVARACTYGSDDIIKYYITGEQVPWEGFKIKRAENREITGSDFGKELIYGITSLLSRDVSRFLPQEEA
jgi:hypothetical protein